MKVSIVTATYNSAKTLNDAIVSVLNQSYSNIEYWIIDVPLTELWISYRNMRRSFTGVSNGFPRGIRESMMR